ncbi:MAG: class II fructose-bisphosphate aldolase [Synergistaceae bacterium]|jgi:ketose-bisphosphate aldolase|nr:class II fructose-bisphosphate aldolase [Synergistaceae bacterium]
MIDAKKVMLKAKQCKTVIPAYNIPYLPMAEPVIRAVVDNNSFAMIQVARVEWEKFSAGTLEAVAEEYMKYKNDEHTLLHLDHVPVIDEDYKKVDYISILERAIKAGYRSVMIDASRLGLEENIRCTKEAVSLAHEAGLPCEAELGAVMGHENRELPPYEEIFRSKRGFTDIEEAKHFVKESGADWLSVAVGTIHGAVAEATRHQKKPEARLDIEHIENLRDALGIPLVLHGGSGINQSFISRGIAAGITKINIGTEIRQTYEQAIRDYNDIARAQDAVYDKTSALITDFLDIKDSRNLL